PRAAVPQRGANPIGTARLPQDVLRAVVIAEFAEQCSGIGDNSDACSRSSELSPIPLRRCYRELYYAFIHPPAIGDVAATCDKAEMAATLRKFERRRRGQSRFVKWPRGKQRVVRRGENERGNADRRQELRRTAPSVVIRRRSVSAHRSGEEFVEMLHSRRRGRRLQFARRRPVSARPTIR